MDFTTLNPQVLEDISRAKELADIVIVCPHWGTEYSSKASSYQKKWAEAMTEAGADVIIGTHPHVVEPVEWITAENGNEALSGKLCILPEESHQHIGSACLGHLPCHRR